MRILPVKMTNTAAQLSDVLREAGYALDTADNGLDAHFLGDSEDYDAVILQPWACRRWMASRSCRNGAPAAARCRF